MALITPADIAVNVYRVDGRTAMGYVEIFRGMIQFSSTFNLDTKAWTTRFMQQAQFDMLPENYQNFIKLHLMRHVKAYIADLERADLLKS